MDEHTIVPTDEYTATGTSTATGKTAKKGKVKTADQPKGKRSLNLSMPIQDYERFALHALRLTGGNISELVCRLGREHLREFHITRTPKGTTGPDS